MRFTILLFVAALTACAPPPAPAPVPGAFSATGPVVLTAGDVKVTQDMIDAVTRTLGPDRVEQMKASGQFAQLEEQIVLGEALYKQALERKLQDDPKVQASLAMGARQALAGELLMRITDERVTDDKIKAYYEEHAVQFKRPEAHARHILVKEEAKALEIVEKLKSGADFATLATENSEDQGSKAKGGDLGWFQQGRMIPEFDKASFEGPLTEIQGPIATRFGFHIIQVQERREATPLEDVKDEIRTQLEQQEQSAFIEEVRGGLKIERGGTETPADGAKPADDKADEAPAPAAPAPAPAPAEGAGH